MAASVPHTALMHGPLPWMAARADYRGWMTEIWESMFASRQVMWGEEPTRSALLACDHLVARAGRTPSTTSPAWSA